jgi:hypothetical protein
MQKWARCAKLTVAIVMLTASSLPLFAVSASTAVSARVGKADAHSRSTRSAMIITGFDARIAEKHGYLVYRLPDGTQLSILPARRAELGGHPGEATLVAAAAGLYRTG